MIAPWIGEVRREPEDGWWVVEIEVDEVKRLRFSRLKYGEYVYRLENERLQPCGPWQDYVFLKRIEIEDARSNG